MTTTSGETVLISIAEILDKTNTPVEFSLNGSSDPFYDPMTLPNNPPIPVLNFYIHDHLGNTRIVYNSSWDCSASDVSYTLEMVIDYYPYGKVLREFVNGQQEQYLTTQHERDVETGLDYRGARFYDAEVGRFLSLDPAAREYPSLSDYCYVAGNPIMFIDPDGRNTIVYDHNGKERYRSVDNHDNAIVVLNEEQTKSVNAYLAENPLEGAEFTKKYTDYANFFRKNGTSYME